MNRLLSFFVGMLIFISTTAFTPQVLKTKLQVHVRNELGNLVEGATVTLYKTEEDYKKEENPVQEPQITDSKGRVKFKELDTLPYFIHVEKGDLNNNGGGIQVGELQRGRLNRSTIIIN